MAILDALGCVDAISFGSECGDAAALQKAAACWNAPRFSQLLRYRLEDGISFPEARQKAVADIAGQKIAALFSRPNNTLGIEYLKALTRLGSAMQPFTIPRFGAEHDEMQPLGDVASASYIRRLAAADGCSTPPPSFRLPVTPFSARRPRRAAAPPRYPGWNGDFWPGSGRWPRRIGGRFPACPRDWKTG